MNKLKRLALNIIATQLQEADIGSLKVIDWVVWFIDCGWVGGFGAGGRGVRLVDPRRDANERTNTHIHTHD
jgi:hypothetical protein